MKNVSVPVPEERSGADSCPSGDRRLRQEARKKSIAEYAREMAGTEFDLDHQLEGASIEHLTACQ